MEGGYKLSKIAWQHLRTTLKFKSVLQYYEVKRHFINICTLPFVLTNLEAFFSELHLKNGIQIVKWRTNFWLNMSISVAELLINCCWNRKADFFSKRWALASFCLVHKVWRNQGRLLITWQMSSLISQILTEHCPAGWDDVADAK